MAGNSGNWTPHEKKLFLDALAIVPEDAPDRWQQIAIIVGKSPAEAWQHYVKLLHELLMIDTGRFDLPNYGDGSASSSWGSDQQGFGTPVESTAGEGERLMDVPWTEEEHRARSAIFELPNLASSWGSNQQGSGTPVGSMAVEGDMEKGVPWTDEEHRAHSVSFELPNSGDGPAASSGGSDQQGSGTPVECKANNGKRRKGMPWTKEEHQLFVAGLQKYGKGDWRSISRNAVMSRTATQVASHAQKFYMRLSSMKEKKRSSIHDITTVDDTTMPHSPPQTITDVGPSSTADHQPTPGSNHGEDCS